MKYVLQDGSGISSDWLLQYVVPNMKKHKIQDRNALVLSLPLLWCCLNPDIQSYVPPHIVHSVTEKYNSLTDVVAYANPVKKIMLIVSGVEGQLAIDEFCELTDVDTVTTGENTTPTRPSLTMHNDSQQLSAIYSKVQYIGRSHDAVKATLDSKFNEVRRQLNVVNSCIHNLGVHPFLQNTTTTCGSVPDAGVDVESANEVEYKYTLSKRPKDLHQLWNEYEFGVGGRVPAKNFSHVQRGRVKHQYYQRNLVWKVVKLHVNAGLTAEAACTKIYDVYGKNHSVSKIIKQLQKDYKKGASGPPDLQI